MSKYAIFTKIGLMAFLLVGVIACKKDTARNQIATSVGPDFRDSLVGSYACMIHQVFYATKAGAQSTDTITGSILLSISKSIGDTGIVVNGEIFNTISGCDNFQITYAGAENSDVNSPATFLSFIYPKDSVVMDTGVLGSIGFREGNIMEMRGHKVH